MLTLQWPVKMDAVKRAYPKRFCSTRMQRHAHVGTNTEVTHTLNHRFWQRGHLWPVLTPWPDRPPHLPPFRLNAPYTNMCVLAKKHTRTSAHTFLWGSTRCPFALQCDPSAVGLQALLARIRCPASPRLTSPSFFILFSFLPSFSLLTFTFSHLKDCKNLCFPWTWRSLTLIFCFLLNKKEWPVQITVPGIHLLDGFCNICESK